MRVLHFAFDEKFIPLAQALYESAWPGANQFRIFQPYPQAPKFVQPAAHVAYVDARYFTSAALQRDYQAHDCLVIHAMLPEFAQGITRVPAHILVVWSGWGFDYYDLLAPQLGAMVLPETAQLWRTAERVTHQQRRWQNWRHYAHWRRTLGNLWQTLTRQRSAFTKIVPRIDVYSVNSAERALMQTALPALRGQYHMLHYCTTEDTFDVGPPRMAGVDILLGNSASETNNHVEALRCLSRLPLDGRKVIAPLSYGDEAYAKAVSRVGQKLLGTAFIPLRDFLPLHQYNQLIASCGSVMMNHKRQQAVGNIGAALYKGARVYLRPENPLFQFYTEMGCTVDDVTALGPDTDAPFTPLSDASQALNRQQVGAFWRRERIITCLRALEHYRARA